MPSPPASFFDESMTVCFIESLQRLDPPCSVTPGTPRDPHGKDPATGVPFRWKTGELFRGRSFYSIS